MRKIAITGPESSGKTSLVKALANFYHCPYTEEYARSFLERKGGEYAQEDLLTILEGQLMLEVNESTKKGNYLFCDTDPLVIWIWSKVKFGSVHPVITKAWKDHLYDLYILVYPDLPWEYDPLRENKNDRDVLFAMYEEKLKTEKRPYIIVKGSQENRLSMAISSLRKLM